jgi:hypothetical protein
MKQISDSCLLLYNCNIMSLHIISLQYRIHGGIQGVNCCSDLWCTWWDHLRINNWGGNTVAAVATSYRLKMIETSTVA